MLFLQWSMRLKGIVTATGPALRRDGSGLQWSMRLEGYCNGHLTLSCMELEVNSSIST